MTLKDILIAGKLTISEGGGGGGGGMLLVTLTVDWSTQTGTADKSFNEILAAFNAGTPVYAYETGFVMPLSFIDESGAQFLFSSVDTANDYMVSYDIFIDSSDTCTFLVKAYSLTPMP